ncbi:MAG: hypothetical protein V2A65_03430 [Candidatus Omnitrophota bacterium]
MTRIKLVGKWEVICLFLFFLLVVFVGIGIPNNIPVISVNYTSIPPVIDGKLDDIWKTAATYNNFYLCNGLIPSAPTVIHLMYDNDNLYIFYECIEPKIKNLKTSEKPHDGEVWADDSADFLLIPSPGPEPVAYHFIANASGSEYDEKISYPQKAEPSWDSTWKAAGSIGEDRWNLEISILWKDLGLIKVQEGLVLAGNFCRARRTVEENSAFLPAGQFRNLEKKVALILGKTSPGVSDLAWEYQAAGERLSLRLNLTNSAETKRLDTMIKKISPAEKILLVKPIMALKDKPVTLDLSVPVGTEDENFSVQFSISNQEDGTLYYNSVPFSVLVKKDLTVKTDQTYYYPEEEIRITVDSKIAGELTLKVTDQKQQVVFEKKLGGVSSGIKEVTLHDKGLKRPGEYTLVVAIFPESGVGKKAVYNFGVVPKAIWPRVAVNKMSIGKEGTILVNGEPFFPISMYDGPIFEDYPQVAYLGFNTVMAGWAEPEQIRTQLEVLKSNGLLANVGLPDVGYGNTLGKKENVKAKVVSIKNHPALLFYHLLDEPAIDYYPTLRLGYQFVKDLDPNHLQYCTLPNFFGYPDSIMDSAATTRDIIAPDIYPFDSYPVSAVSEAVKMCVQAAKRTNWQKTVIYVGPCFQWLPCYRLPTPIELRLVAYLAIINGAKGIDWYSYREPGLEKAGTGFGLHTSEAAELQGAFKRLNSEISQLYLAICAPNPPPYFQAETGEGVELILKEGRDVYYLITANTDKIKKEVSFNLKKPSSISDSTTISVFYEYRNVEMKGEIMTDFFEPYEVHIYVIPKGGKKK